MELKLVDVQVDYSAVTQQYEVTVRHVRMTGTHAELECRWYGKTWANVAEGLANIGEYVEVD